LSVEYKKIIVRFRKIYGSDSDLNFKMKSKRFKCI
jgi:hypothetical protein